MTDYIAQALKEINLCGIEGRPKSYCQYVPNCTTLGATAGKFICLSKMAYDVAGYLEGSDVKTERSDLRDFVQSNIGVNVIDPNDGQWHPEPLKESDIGKFVDMIIHRGQNMRNMAITLGSQRNPINFDCTPEDIAADL